MNKELIFRAVLAMDAYNRSDSQNKVLDRGIANLGGENSQIGNVVITKTITNASSSFAATTYRFFAGVNIGEKVISYRGTDQLIGNKFNVFNSDLVNDYGVGTGSQKT